MRSWKLGDVGALIDEYAAYLTASIFDLLADEALDEAEIAAAQSLDELNSQVEAVLADRKAAAATAPVITRPHQLPLAA